MIQDFYNLHVKFDVEYNFRKVFLCVMSSRALDGKTGCDVLSYDRACGYGRRATAIGFKY